MKKASSPHSASEPEVSCSDVKASSEVDHGYVNGPVTLYRMSSGVPGKLSG